MIVHDSTVNICEQEWLSKKPLDSSTSFTRFLVQGEEHLLVMDCEGGNNALAARVNPSAVFAVLL